jgi:exonuclease III
MISWNSQALYAVDHVRQEHKELFLRNLLRTRDMCLLQETHFCKDIEAMLPLDEFERWNSGLSQREAGVAIWVRKTWMAAKGVTKRPEWTPIVQGRSAQLRLETREGTLTVAVVYLPSGDNKVARQDTLRRTLAHVPTYSDSAYWIAGDFNFVTETQDRLHFGSGRCTGDKDEGEAAEFTAMAAGLGLRELFQPEHTHRTSSGTSRLDRCYTNRHVCERLDSEEFASVSPWCTAVSNHRALLFGIRPTTTGRPAS